LWKGTKTGLKELKIRDDVSKTSDKSNAATNEVVKKIESLKEKFNMTSSLHEKVSLVDVDRILVIKNSNINNISLQVNLNLNQNLKTKRT